MKKIVQFFARYRNGFGGMETHITELVKNLSYEFEIISDAIPGYPLIEQYSKNVTIRRFKPYNYGLTPSKSIKTKKILFPYRVLTDIVRIKNKHKYLKKVNYALVHFHDPGVGGALIKSSYMLKSAKIIEILTDYSYVAPKILTVHGLSCLMTDDPLIKEQELTFINQFENIICVDQRLYEFLKDNLEDKRVWHVPNSIDTKRFKFTPLSIDKNLRVGFIGRLEKSRGLSLLYDFIDNLPSYIDFYVLGAGNSIAIKKFQSRVDVTKIHFETNINYEDVHTFYRKFDVLFNPVIAEGISRVTLEAMSSGRPVIMLDKGNRYPVINKKTGYLIKDDIEELLNLLRYIHENEDELKAVAKNARVIVEKEYDNSVIIPKIGDIYGDIIK
jgi:glycosyltransferase involved in cell wall biosynthesis